MAAYDKENKSWQSLQNDLGRAETKKDTTDSSLGQQFLDILRKYGPKVAQINDDTGVQLTYDEIRLYAIRASQNLLKRGFKPRDVFGFLVDHSDHLAPIMVAAMCLGSPMAPLYYALSSDEIVRFFRMSKPSVVFCESEVCNTLNDVLKKLPFSVQIFTINGEVDGFESVEKLFVETGEEDQFVPVEIDEKIDICAVSCSSGTTGPSKYLQIPYARCINLRHNPLDSNHIVLDTDSIYWVVGLSVFLGFIQSGVTRIIKLERVTPEVSLHLMDKYKITYSTIAANELIACIKTDLIRNANLSSVRQIFTYGSKIPTNLVAEVHRYFPNSAFSSWYGCTEIGVISEHPYNAGENNYGGGKLSRGCIAKIVDDNGNRCGPNVAGELCIFKKENLFRGYYDDSATTAAAIDAEGFYRTGDIAHFDDGGRLYIRDRKKNVLLLFYYDSVMLPFELEEFLNDKIHGIKEVCVVGVPIVGSTVLPAAMIVLEPGVNLTKGEVFDKIAETFPKRSWLRAGVYFVESLPKTNNGKLVRHEITKMAIEMFEAAKYSDPEVRSYLSNFPPEYKKLIFQHE